MEEGSSGIQCIKSSIECVSSFFRSWKDQIKHNSLPALLYMLILIILYFVLLVLWQTRVRGSMIHITEGNMQGCLIAFMAIALAGILACFIKRLNVGFVRLISEQRQNTNGYMMVGVYTFGAGSLFLCAQQMFAYTYCPEENVSFVFQTVRLLFTMAQILFLQAFCSASFTKSVWIILLFYHIIATNVCVWLFYIVQETVVLGEQEEDPVHLVCLNRSHVARSAEMWETYTSPFTLEYSLIVTGVIFGMKNQMRDGYVICSTEADDINACDDLDEVERLNGGKNHDKDIPDKDGKCWKNNGRGSKSRSLTDGGSEGTSSGNRGTIITNKAESRWENNGRGSKGRSAARGNAEGLSSEWCDQIIADGDKSYRKNNDLRSKDSSTAQGSSEGISSESDGQRTESDKWKDDTTKVDAGNMSSRKTSKEHVIHSHDIAKAKTIGDSAAKENHSTSVKRANVVITDTSAPENKTQTIKSYNSGTQCKEARSNNGYESGLTDTGRCDSLNDSFVSLDQLHTALSKDQGISYPKEDDGVTDDGTNSSLQYGPSVTRNMKDKGQIPSTSCHNGHTSETEEQQVVKWYKSSHPGFLFGLALAIVMIVSSLSLEQNNDKTLQNNELLFHHCFTALVIVCQYVAFWFMVDCLKDLKWEWYGLKSEDYLVIGSGLGIIAFDKLYIIAEIDNFRTQYPNRVVPALTCFHMLINFIGLVIQMAVIIRVRRYHKELKPYLVASARRNSSNTTGNTPCLSQSCLFLMVVNLGFWAVDSFFEIKTNTLFPGAEHFYGKLWRYFIGILYPLAIFFRFHSSMVLLDIWYEFCKSDTCEGIKRSRDQIDTTHHESV